MAKGFRIKKINTNEEEEFHNKGNNAIKTQLVVTIGTNLFQHWMQTNSKLNKTEHVLGTAIRKILNVE